MIALLLLGLGIGVPALVGSPDDQQAQPQVQPGDGDLSTNRVKLGTFVAE